MEIKVYHHCLTDAVQSKISLEFTELLGKIIDRFNINSDDLIILRFTEKTLQIKFQREYRSKTFNSIVCLTAADLMFFREIPGLCGVSFSSLELEIAVDQWVYHKDFSFKGIGNEQHTQNNDNA